MGRLENILVELLSLNEVIDTKIDFFVAEIYIYQYSFSLIYQIKNWNIRKIKF
jgi:hypothetical protein